MGIAKKIALFSGITAVAAGAYFLPGIIGNHAEIEKILSTSSSNPKEIKNYEKNDEDNFMKEQNAMFAKAVTGEDYNLEENKERIDQQNISPYSRNVSDAEYKGNTLGKNQETHEPDPVKEITLIDKDDFQKEFDNTKNNIDNSSETGFKDKFDAGASGNVTAGLEGGSMEVIPASVNLSSEMPAQPKNEMTQEEHKPLFEDKEASSSVKSSDEKEDDSMNEMEELFKEAGKAAETPVDMDELASQLPLPDLDSLKTDLEPIEPEKLEPAAADELKPEKIEPATADSMKLEPLEMPKTQELTQPDIKAAEAEISKDMQTTSVLSDFSGLKISDSSNGQDKMASGELDFNKEYESIIKELESPEGIDTGELYQPKMSSMSGSASEEFSSAFGKYNLGSGAEDYKMPDYFSNSKMPTMESLQSSLPEMPKMDNAIANIANKKSEQDLLSPQMPSLEGQQLSQPSLPSLDSKQILSADTHNISDISGSDISIPEMSFTKNVTK